MKSKTLAAIVGGISILAMPVSCKRVSQNNVAGYAPVEKSVQRENLLENEFPKEYDIRITTGDERRYDIFLDDTDKTVPSVFIYLNGKRIRDFSKIEDKKVYDLVQSFLQENPKMDKN